MRTPRLGPTAGTWVDARTAATFAGDTARLLGWVRVLGGCWRVPQRVLLIAGLEEMRPEWQHPPGITLALVRRDTGQPPRVMAKFQIRALELTVLAVLVELARDPTRRPPADVTPGAPVETATAHQGDV